MKFCAKRREMRVYWKGNSTSKHVTFIQDMTLFSWRNLSNRRCAQSKCFGAFRTSSRCSIYSGLTAFLPPREGKSNQRWKIDGIHAATQRLYTCTGTRIQTHTHTSSSTRTYSHPCRVSACTQNRLLSYSCFVRAPSSASPPQVFSKIHAYKRQRPYESHVLSFVNKDCGNLRGNTPSECQKEFTEAFVESSLYCERCFAV